MEEVKVGEYVRTKSGNIDKIDALYGMIEKTVHLEKHKWQDTRNIIKHSFNIIDLIEVGDYVNGEKVIEVDSFKDWIDIGTDVIREKDIKSIVTKQQYESMEYKV